MGLAGVALEALANLPMKKLLVLISLAFAALPASAQLDLPDKGDRKEIPVKPAPSTRGGVELPSTARGDVRPRRPGIEVPGGLVTPDRPKSSGAPVQGEAGWASATAEEAAAGAIFDHLRGLRNPAEEILGEAALSLASMGALGLSAARQGLVDENTGIVLASAKALLLGDRPLDQSLVRARLDVKLPTSLLTDLLTLQLEALDPPSGMELLVKLLDHKRSAVRKIAAKQYRERVTVVDRPTLFTMAGSERSDARSLALELLAAYPGSDVDSVLLEGLEDRVARVASDASALLSKRVTGEGDPLLAALILKARVAGYDDNAGAHALLTVIEAEDRLGLSVVPAAEAINLLIHMRKGEPFVSAVCAIALAGIGFRSEEHMESLDLEVPHTLVASVSGGVYYPEYSIVRPAAIRRLSQITGQFLGDDGVRWQQWWLSSASEFSALRAVMNVEPVDHAILEVRWYSPAAAESFRLLGSLTADQNATYPGQTLRLVPDKSTQLMQVLSQSGIFEADRLPGLVGEPTGVENELEVRVGDQAKLFRLGSNANADWMKPVLASLRAFRDESLWQLFPGVQYGLTNEGRNAFFQAESAFWNTEHTELERDRRLVNLMLDNVSMVDVEQRDGAIAEALRIYGKPGVPSEVDFPLLVNLLRDEAFFGERARGILTLALRSGRTVVLESGEVLPLVTDLAGELLDVLVVGSDLMRMEPLSMVLQSSSLDFQWSAAQDPRPGIRAVAAPILARNQDEKSIQLLRQLLSDPELTVEAATVRAVVNAGLSEFESEVLLRARVGDPIVRLSALRGLAGIKSDESFEVLRLALLEQDPRFRQVAADSLAALADPRSTTLLASMFAAGPEGPLFKAGSLGLSRIGEPAWNDLLGLARSHTNNCNREAALILSAQAVFEVTPILLTMMTDNPSDSVLANELAVLTCVDYSAEPNPAGAYWGWWDRKVSDNPTIWFSDALRAADLSMYGSNETLLGGGTVEGGLGLLSILRGETSALPFLVERARRELQRMLGVDIGKIPPAGTRLTLWCDDLEVRLEKHFLLEAQEASAAKELEPSEPLLNGKPSSTE